MEGMNRQHLRLGPFFRHKYWQWSPNAAQLLNSWCNVDYTIAPTSMLRAPASHKLSRNVINGTKQRKASTTGSRYSCEFNTELYFNFSSTLLLKWKKITSNKWHKQNAVFFLQFSIMKELARSQSLLPTAYFRLILEVGGRWLIIR